MVKERERRERGRKEREQERGKGGRRERRERREREVREREEREEDMSIWPLILMSKRAVFLACVEGEREDLSWTVKKTSSVLGNA